MTIINANEVKAFAQLIAPAADFDSVFTFYHDETNNVGKFYVKDDAFNVDYTANFVLGGLVHEGAAPDIQPLIASFKLQANALEVKFKHIASGDFTTCLTSTKLKLYLEFLKDNEIFVHYSSLNILYWALVDIVDSAIQCSDKAIEAGPVFANHLKNDLYQLARLEIDAFINLFHDLEYPNIKENKVSSFIDRLSAIIEMHVDDHNLHFGLRSLLQLLKETQNSGELIFIMNEQDHVLLQNLSHFYLRPIYTFTKSSHIFDRVDTIATLINEYEIQENEVKISNYAFVDSKDYPLIQLSDVFIGLMGKLFQYLNTNTLDKITFDFQSLKPMAEENIDLLIDVLDKSVDRNIGFAHSVNPPIENEKFRIIRRLRNK